MKHLQTKKRSCNGFFGSAFFASCPPHDTRLVRRTGEKNEAYYDGARRSRRDASAVRRPPLKAFRPALETKVRQRRDPRRARARWRTLSGFRATNWSSSTLTNYNVSVFRSSLWPDLRVTMPKAQGLGFPAAEITNKRFFKDLTRLTRNANTSRRGTRNPARCG